MVREKVRFDLSCRSPCPVCRASMRAGGEAYGRPSNEGCPALRFWTMLARRQGAPLNMAELARSLAPRAERGFHAACEDLSPACRFVVYPGPERFHLSADTEAMPQPQLSMLLHRHAKATG
jgi:hypothetical protein